MKKSLALLAGLALSSSALAGSTNIARGTWTWYCPFNDVPGAVEISYANGKIVREKIREYEVIRDGKQLPDEEIGLSVFDVYASSLNIRNDSQVSFALGLQDYSDEQTWKVQLNAVQAADGGPLTYSATVVSTFKSSDGDNELHRYKEVLECKATELRI